MKKAKQTLTAALAATLATGVVGSVASAATNDDLYKAAYSAMVKAQTEKTQTAINEARVAINALPKELDWAKGEFSKQVDTVQQPIYTQIIALIEKGNKEAKQETINEGRKLLVGVEEAYAKTWSSNFDTIQQTIVKNATDAVAAATKSQKAEDIEKAKALVAELKTAENADVKKAVETMEKDLVEKIDVRVEKVEAMNATTVQVTFSKDIDKDTIDKENFVVKTGSIRIYATDAKLVDGKNNIVEVTLQTKMDAAKEYEVTVSGIRDAKGGVLKTSTTKVKYDKKEIASVEFTTKKAVRNGNVRDMLLVKDEAGRDITKEAKLSFECSSDKSIVTKDGKISSSAKIGKEVTMRVYSGDKILAEDKVTIAENLAQTIIGFTVSKGSVPDDTKFEEITANNKMKVGTTNGILTIFYKDALGNEKKIEGGQLKKIESLNKDVLSVTGGKLVANKTGIATLKVVYGDIEEQLDIEVVKTDVETATLSMKDNVIAVAKSDAQKAVRYTLNDNSFGDGVTPTYAEVKIWNETRSQWEVNSAVTVPAPLKDKIVVVNGRNLKTGDTAAKLMVTYGNVKYETEFTINVSDAEKFNGYELAVENHDTTIGKTVTTLDQVDGDQAYLKVYALDDNGNRIRDNVGATYQLFVDGNVVSTGATLPVNLNSLSLSKGEHSYFMRVTRNSGLKYDTNTVTVTIENTDSASRNLYVSPTTTTSSTLSSIFSWTYGEDNKGLNAEDIQALDADVVSGGNLIVSNGQRLKDAIKGAYNLRGAALKSYLDGITFQNAGYFEIRVNSATVNVGTNAAPEFKVIDDVQTYDVTIQQ